jgi:hypothetical protein
MCDEMTLAANIIGTLKLTGMVSGGYLGYCYGNKLKKWCCDTFPTVNHYNNEYISKSLKKSQLSEETMFGLFGCFSGILIGFNIWPVSIPVTINKVVNDYPKEFTKIKKFIKD